MMKYVALLALIVIVTPAVADIWTNCSPAGAVFKLSEVTITPDPPVHGENITVVLNGTMSETITSGIVALDVKYSIITLLNKNLSLCAETKCPIAAGVYGTRISDLIPGDAPTAGVYNILANVYDQKDAIIACAKVDFKMGSK
jgi:hypothetical protein